MMKTEQAGREPGTIIRQAFTADKPVMPSTAEHEKLVRKSADPSSSTRNNRYPVPSFFEQRLQRAE
jgi:hypothetical protein